MFERSDYDYPTKVYHYLNDIANGRIHKVDLLKVKTANLLKNTSLKQHLNSMFPYY